MCAVAVMFVPQASQTGREVLTALGNGPNMFSILPSRNQTRKSTSTVSLGDFQLKSSIYTHL